MQSSEIITNWKLKEVLNDLEIVSSDSISFIEKILETRNIPEKYNERINRGETYIDWKKMITHYSFFFDNEGWEEKIKLQLEKSEINKTAKLLITYGRNEPVVKIPTHLYLTDWEGFFASAQWQTLIFSEDYKLIMEVSRDYYLHSNFKIMDE